MRFALLLFAFSTQALQAEDTSGGVMLYRALMVGDLKTIEIILSSGVNPNLPLRFGQTALYLAISSNQTEALDLLLRWNADPNVHLKSGRDNGEFPVTALQFA